MNIALETVTDIDFEVVKEFLTTGESSAIHPKHQQMLEICRDCWGLMKKYPARNMLINQLMAKDNLSHKVAAKYVDFTRASWGQYMDYNQEFLKTYFIQKLMDEINDPKAKPEVRAKNLAVLQKHIAAMPATQIDPSLMESNNITINIDLGGRNIQLSQERIKELPSDIQEILLGSVSKEITEDVACEILDS